MAPWSAFLPAAGAGERLQGGRKREEVAANKLSVIKAAKRRRSLCRMSRKGASGGAAVVKLITASLRRCSQEGWRQSSGRRRSTWEQRHVAGRVLPLLPPPRPFQRLMPDLKLPYYFSHIHLFIFPGSLWSGSALLKCSKSLNRRPEQGFSTPWPPEQY